MITSCLTDATLIIIITLFLSPVTDFYDLDRGIVSTAMTYLDRMLSASMMHYRLNKNQCFLLSMACLKLAIKVSTPYQCIRALILSITYQFAPAPARDLVIGTTNIQHE